MIFYLRHSGRTDFGKLYFQNEDPLTATLAAFGTYFTELYRAAQRRRENGHYGAHRGRKQSLLGRVWRDWTVD